MLNLEHWRLAKLEYVEALDTHERRRECVAEELFVHLAPILNKQALVQAEKTVHAQVLKLCRDLARNRPSFCLDQQTHSATRAEVPAHYSASHLESQSH